MPTINKRFLLKLILVLLVSTGVLVGVHAVQARRIPAALLAQSERAAEAGKMDIAVHYLRQYLEFYPEDVEAHVKLADLLEKRTTSARGQWDLLFLYDKILRLEPDRHPIRRKALAVSLRVGRNPDAVTHAEYLLKTSPTEAALWQQLATAQAGLNEIQSARRSYEEAVKYAPQDITNYQRLAHLVWKNMNDAAGAREVLNRLVQSLPREADAYLIRARFELYTAEEYAGQSGAGGDLSRARLDLLRAFELDPENAEASLLLAEVMQRNKNIPAAHAILRDAASLHPRNLKLIRALSWLELIRGNSAAAITVLEDGLKFIPDGFDLMVPLADLLVQQGDTVRTGEILQRLQARKAPPTQVKYLQARVAMREQRWPDAVRMLEALRAELVNTPGLEMQLNLLLASCFAKLGDAAAEENAYQRVTNADPKHVIARVGLGNLYMNLGRFEDAAREFDIAVQSPYATAVVVAQWVKLKIQLLQAANAPGEWQKLDHTLNTFVARFGRGSSEPVMLRAEVLAAQGRLNEAVKLLRKEAVLRPGDPRIWAALALTTADLSGCAAGLAVMDEAQAIVGDCVDVRLARATLYAREPGRVRPIESLGEGIETWPDSEQIRLLSGLVEVYDQLEDQPNVVRTLRRIVARQPLNTAMWLKLHERCKPGDQHTVAARAALVKLEGENGPSVVLCDARAADPAGGAAHASRLVEAFGANPTRADACLVLARFKLATGDVTTSAALTERAFRLEPTRYETAEALLTHFAQRHDMDRLRQTLLRLAADPRWSGEPFRRVVSHVMRAVPQAAVELLALCRPMVEHDPQGPAWLAECAVIWKLPEAPALLDAAAKRPTATSDDWLRKALHEAKDDPAAGPRVLAEAKAKLAPAPYFAIVAVYADSAAGSTFVPEGDTAQEKRLLAQARLAVKLSRSKPAEAGKVLEAFLADKDISPADADWARRNLAMIYAVGGTPDDRLRAMKLLKDVQSDDTTLEALRATVSAMTVLARYLEGPDRREVLAKAITALEAIYKTSKAPTDLFSLSKLYRAVGNRRESRRCLQQLLSRKPEELAVDPSYAFYLTAALDELVEDSNFASAKAFADKLIMLRANDFNSLSAIARFEAKAGRPERGLAVAEDYARLADSNSGDYIIRSAQVAELLDELSRLPNVRGTPTGRLITNAAVERFAAIVPNRPEAIVGLVGSYAADGRATEAFESIERLGRYVPARLRASAGLAIVRAGEVSDRQAELVLKWLDGCLAEEPDSVPLLLSKAEFLAIRNDTANASTTFEKVLAKEPRNVVALNNLAWLHAADPRTAEKALELMTRATKERGLTGDLLDTRARVRITLKQFKEAEADLAEAISHDPTALRWFHVALLRMSQTAPSPAEAAKAFAEAKRRGLTEKMIHPADLPTYRVLDTAKDK
jgi:tetratricopeptide (TPR) repeat protein